jgi:hypothetical protein
VSIDKHLGLLWDACLDDTYLHIEHFA